MFKINEKLKDSILSKVPAEFDKLEKAIFIYHELCKKLEYSLPFYLEEKENMDYYRNINNLADIDGEKRKDVVCFTFNAIYGQLLVDGGIISDKELQANGQVSTSDPNKLVAIHEPFYVILYEDNNEIIYECDSTYGVLDNNDLIGSKYKASLDGWRTLSSDNKVLQNAKNKVLEYINEIENAQQQYIQMKNESGSLIELPLEERRDMFLQLATSEALPPYSILTFNYILKLKHLLFKKEELKSEIDKIAEVLFVKDKTDGQYKCLFLFNKKGYTNDKGYENFENLEVYEITPTTKAVEKISMEELAQRQQSRYVDRDDKKVSTSMIKEGKVHIIPQYEGGKAIYNNQQKAINIKGYLRHFIKEDKTVQSDAEGNVLE